MASLPYPRRPPNSFHRTHSKFIYASPPTEFTEFTEASGGGYSPTDCTEYTEASGGEEPPTDFTDAHGFLGCVLPPNLCTSVQSVGVFVGGYGIPAIPTQPTNYLPTEFTEHTETTGGEEKSVYICEIRGRLLPEGAYLLCWCSRDCCTP